MFEDLFEWFQNLGEVYTLLGLFLILVVDSTVFPALPELFAVLAILMHPSLGWGLMVLATALVAEVTGNSLLYFLVKRNRLPDFIERAIKKWTGFLFVRDERIILVNRVAPVLPFTGAFMATCDWNYRRSMLYLVTGGILKYSALFGMVVLLDYQFDRDQAQIFSLVAVVVIIILSSISSYLYRKKHGTREH